MKCSGSRCPMQAGTVNPENCKLIQTCEYATPVSDRPIIEIARKGVVNISSGYEADIKVNSQSILDLICKELDSVKPECDCYGQFAGIVNVKIKILGDLKDEN